MQNNLMNTLVERNLLNDDTLVTAMVNSVGFNGVVGKFKKEVNWDYKITSDMILAIEGMDPARFAKSYNIKPDGSTNAHKKRGRKPKPN
jgi:hypothetical protein